MKTRLLLPLLTLTALPLIPARADILGFGTGTNYTLTQGQTAAGPSISNGVATLTTGANYQGNAVFYNTVQNITSFQASFTYQNVLANGVTAGPNVSADGFTFTLQNDARGAAAIGYDGNALGYAGTTNNTGNGQTAQNAVGTNGLFGLGTVRSAAVGFNIYGNSTTGLGTAGTLSLNNTTGTGTAGVLLYSGHPIDVTLTYQGTTLTQTLLDRTTGAQVSYAYTVNLANVLGANTAYVGFTGADGMTTSTQTISNFTFGAVPEPSTWTAAALGLGLCALAVRRQYRARGAGIVSK